MAKIFQNSAAKGTDTIPTSGEAADVLIKKTSFTFPGAVVASDGAVVELAILPARHYIADIRYIETGAVTEGKIGIMAGEVGDTVPANRAIATNIVTGGKANDAAFAIAPVEYDRSIGVEVTAADAAAGVTLVLLYAQ